MSRRGILLLVFAGLFVLFCVGWALATQALADGAGQINHAGPQVQQAPISAYDPIPPPPPPPRG